MGDERLADRGPTTRTGGTAVAVISLRKLSKRYGSHRALFDIDLEIGRGEVFGYLGPNGSGKTTTIRILLGLLRPTTGDATVLGLDAWRDSVQIQARVGYVPGDPGLWDKLTGAETITYLSNLRGAPHQVARAHELSERLGLELQRPVRALSRGNRQKLVIVQAFMGEPELLVLDEPTSGLDPLVQRELHAMTRETTERGGTVVLSSHVLDDVQRVADRVGIIRAGRLVAVERLEDLRARAVHHVSARFPNPVAPDRFARIPGISHLESTDHAMSCRVPERSLDAVVKALAACEVSDVSITEADLEEMFLAYYGEAGDDAA